MKILYLIGAFYPSQIGGPCNAIAWLVKAIKNNGIQTTVVATTFGIDSEKHNIRPNTWTQNEFGKVIYCKYLSMNIPIEFMRVSLLEISKNDVVHLNSIFHFPMLVFAVWARLLRKKIVWDPGGELAPNALKYGWLKKKIYLRVFRVLMFKYPVLFHTTSDQESADLLSNLGKGSIVFQVPNFIEKIDKVEVPKKNQLLFLGRIHPIKAIDNLILSLVEISPDSIGNCRLIIAGDCNNSYGNNLKEMVKSAGLESRVDFIGHVEGDRKNEIIAESKYLVLPSHSENFANVVTESLSQGTPVIASTGTPWRILEERKAGFYCSNTPLELARTIENAIKIKDSEYEDLCQNSLDLVRDEFSMNSGVFKWIEAYEKI